MNEVKHDEIRQAVRENYGAVARATAGCGPACCTPAELPAADAPLPEEVRRDLALYTGCIAGAAAAAEIEQMLAAAGFAAIRIEAKDASREFIWQWAPGRGVEDYVCSANIEAVKP